MWGTGPEALGTLRAVLLGDRSLGRQRSPRRPRVAGGSPRRWGSPPPSVRGLRGPAPRSARLSGWGARRGSSRRSRGRSLGLPHKCVPSLGAGPVPRQGEALRAPHCFSVASGAVGRPAGQQAPPPDPPALGQPGLGFTRPEAPSHFPVDRWGTEARGREPCSGGSARMWAQVAGASHTTLHSLSSIHLTSHCSY